MHDDRDTIPTPAAIRSAAITLLGEQVGQTSLWTELWRCLGRAEEAATAGDLASARANLEAAADLEYDLTGSAEVVGAVLATTGDEPAPPTTRTGEAPSAPTLHAYDTGEELRDATGEELAASVEAARHDGGAGVIRVDGRRCYVEGPAPLVHWSELRVWGFDGDRLDEADARDALAEYRRTGAMMAWLADPADYGPGGEPLSGEGPELHDAGPSRDEIDWAGFPGGAS